MSKYSNDIGATIYNDGAVEHQCVERMADATKLLQDMPSLDGITITYRLCGYEYERTGEDFLAEQVGTGKMYTLKDALEFEWPQDYKKGANTQ